MADTPNASNDEKLRAALERLKKSQDQLMKLHTPLLRLFLSDLEDLHSSFPETQVFLKARGLASVRQLDEKGLEELMRHLCDVLFKKNPQIVT